jgi:LysR family glycine cleavage system transcriptional activator
MKSLPSFEALRVFEVAARHGSFTRAAEELHVTHGAVSHRIKSLESRLRVVLFQRRGNNMVLTDDGTKLFASVNLAIGEISRGIDRLSGKDKRSELTVSLLPVMAARWLIPRLSRFHDRHPTIGINVRTSLTLANFGVDGIDIAIRYGPGKWQGLRAIKLADEELFPVCSPNFNEGRLPTNPAELLKLPLLRDLNLPWERWFTHAGVTWKGELHGTSFTDANLVLHAAVRRQGIALARSSIVADELSSGRLVRLFELGLPTAYSHFIVYPERSERIRAIVLFRDWLLEEAAGQPITVNDT